MDQGLAVASSVESQTEKNMEHEMDTWVIRG